MPRYLIALTALLVSWSPAWSIPTTLLDLQNAPFQVRTPYSLSFTATGSLSTLYVAGYQVLSFESVINSKVVANGSTTNLLGSNWDLTPAASGSLAFQTPNALRFGGFSVGSYDSFSQSFATTVGDTYTYSFLYTNLGPRVLNGLRISVDSPISPAIPEASTWMMMLLGFGAMGMSLRRRQKLTPGGLARIAA